MGPGGFDQVAAQQEAFWREPLEVILKAVQLSLFGEIDPDIGFTFTPLYQMTPKEESEIRLSDSQADCAYIAFSAAYAAVTDLPARICNHFNFSAAYAAVTSSAGHPATFIFFSAAYAAVTHLANAPDSGLPFSAAYAAVTGNVSRYRLLLAFSAAYAAVTKQGLELARRACFLSGLCGRDG